MGTITGRLLALAALSVSAFAEKPKTVGGLKNPESAVVGPGGRVFVTLMGERGRPGDGSIAIVDPLGKITTFLKGLDDPHGLDVVGDFLFVVDIKRIWKVDGRAKVELLVGPESFPRSPGYLNDIVHDGLGNFYVSDSGNLAGKRGGVFRIDAKKRVTLVLDAELTMPRISIPDGLLMDDFDHLFVADAGLGELYRYDLIIGTPQRISGGFGATDGLAREPGGGLFVGDWRNGRLFQVNSELEPPAFVSDRFQSVADIAMMPDGRTLLIPDTKAGTLTWFPIR